MMARIPTSRRSRGGFTFLEVMLAVVILAFASITLIWAISTGQAQSFEARERVEAALAVEAVLSKTVATVDYIDLEWLGPTPSNGHWVHFEVGEEVTETVPIVGVSVTGKPLRLYVERNNGSVLAEINYFYHAPF